MSDRPAKKTRHKKDAPINVVQRCYLSRLPLELLISILLQTTSPKDVLAVARCSKYFCMTLIQESCAFIWRYLRTKCEPEPIPDPTPNLTEPAFAALFFDGGECEICGKWTPLPYASFALRLRVCDKKSCWKYFINNCVASPRRSSHSRHIISTWLPYMESDSSKPIQYWPNIQPVHRKAEWDLALKMYKEASQSPTSLQKYLAQRQGEIDRLPLIMSFAQTLSKWRSNHQAVQRRRKEENDAIARAIAKKEGWETFDLLNAYSYRELHRNRNNILEAVKESDYNLIRLTVEAQIIINLERRKRRSEENSYRRRREDVEQHFNRLKSAGGDEPLPTLPTFRKLPIVKVLQSKTSNSHVAKDLKVPFVTDSLRVDLTKWRESARADLAGVLGYPGWNTASSKKLHPVDRLTARFQCSRCCRVSSKYREDGSFDFAGACAHRCFNLNKRGRAKEEWRAEQFVKDDKAIAAILGVLGLCGVDAEDKASLDAVKSLGVRIMCLSCESTIVMGFRSIVGHSQRHDHMRVSLLLVAEATSILTFPIKDDLCSMLMDPDSDGCHREKRSYGCRHCLQGEKPALLLGNAGNSGFGHGHDPHLKTESSGTKKKLYTFDGMRSHVKEKHRILALRDEDLYDDS